MSHNERTMPTFEDAGRRDIRTQLADTAGRAFGARSSRHIGTEEAAVVDVDGRSRPGRRRVRIRRSVTPVVIVDGKGLVRIRVTA
jgi:hypothetical protein